MTVIHFTPTAQAGEITILDGRTTHSEKYQKNSGVTACIAPRLVAAVDVKCQVTPNKKLLTNGTNEYERMYLGIV
jgi:hypothetical protein